MGTLPPWGIVPEMRFPHRTTRAAAAANSGRRTAGRARARTLAAGAALAVTALAGCSGTGEADPSSGSAATSPSAAPGAEEGASPSAAGLPSMHVHAAAFDPGDGALVLATHDGLFRYDSAGSPQQVGPTLDLMGFTVAGPGRYYSSGHPGPGSELPQPLGLIESTDAGATWSELSRGGASDFHALTAVDGGVVGFDGQLRSSADGQEWSILQAPVQPFALAASSASSVVLATSEEGLVRSDDAGVTWSRVDGAPLLQVAAVTDEGSAVGITPTGQVAVSDDAGASWQLGADAGEAPQAVAVRPSTSGELEVVVVTASGLMTSTDGARTFAAGWRPQA